MTRFKRGIFFVIAVLFFFNWTGLALAACYEASGFGGTGWNGTYTDTGTTYDSHPVWSNGTNFLGYANANSSYNLWTDSAGNFTGAYFYSNHTGDPVEETIWWPQNGAPSAGIVATTTCPSVATTTDMSAFGLWGAIATGTGELIGESGVPFGEIAFGLVFAIMLFLVIVVTFGKGLKRLLSGKINF